MTTAKEHNTGTATLPTESLTKEQLIELTNQHINRTKQLETELEVCKQKIDRQQDEPLTEAQKEEAVHNKIVYCSRILDTLIGAYGPERGGLYLHNALELAMNGVRDRHQMYDLAEDETVEISRQELEGIFLLVELSRNIHEYMKVSNELSNAIPWGEEYCISARIKKEKADSTFSHAKESYPKYAK